MIQKSILNRFSYKYLPGIFDFWYFIFCVLFEICYLRFGISYFGYCGLNFVFYIQGLTPNTHYN